VVLHHGGRAAPVLKVLTIFRVQKSMRSCTTGPGGYWRGAGAWALGWKSFMCQVLVLSQPNIRMTGYLYGLTSAAAGGSSSSDVDLALKDSTTGTSYSSFNVYSVSCGGLGWENVDQSFNNRFIS